MLMCMLHESLACVWSVITTKEWHGRPVDTNASVNSLASFHGVMGPQAVYSARDNILHVRGLETAPDTIKMAETIIIMPCCAGKSRQPNSTIPFRYVQTKLQSFSNWGNHNRKLESVCPRYKMPEKHNGYANLP